MARYIDADALLNKVEQYFSGLPIVVHHDMVEFIENAPTADVVEVEGSKAYKCLSYTTTGNPTADVVERKVGKWKQGYCSECGYNWGKDAPIASVPNFCPNCGARMEK